MAQSVDTLIDNAVSRAKSAGSTTIFNANSAVDGVDPKPKLKIIVPSPPGSSAQLLLPESNSSGTNYAFGQTIENALNDFFDTFFSPADAYFAAEAWAIDALSTSDPELPGSNLDLIWGRAQDSTQALGDDLVGLDIPVEALTPHTSLGYDAFVYAEAYSRSSVKVSLWAHAVGLQMKDLRAAAITATGNYIKAIAQSNVAALRGSTAVEEAITNMKRTSAAWFLAQVNPLQIAADNASSAVREKVVSSLIDADQNVNTVELKVTAAVQAAEAIAIVAQAAAASANSIVSSSVAGFE